MNTIKKILASADINSHNLYKVWDKFSYSTLIKILNYYLEERFRKTFAALITKSNSSFSRAQVTIVNDDSIFKTFLKDVSDCPFFGKYFSGQTHKSEYGFKLNLSGVTINKEFYPIRFELVKTSEKSTDVAGDSIAHIIQIINEEFDNQGISRKKVAVSVDSGFNSDDLITLTEFDDDALFFISVPKVNHKITIGKSSMKIKDYINNVFLKKEAQYYEKLKGGKESEEPFSLRIRARYHCRDREVVFLFFRFNNSKKVSVIFSNDLLVKAKTLRRCWFNRNKIEQYFRFLKDTLKIQQSTAVNATCFLKKLALFFFKSSFCLDFQKHCQKVIPKFSDISFWKIRQFILNFNVGKTLLIDVIREGGFCNRQTLYGINYQLFMPD